MSRKLGGTIYIKIDGEMFDAKGTFTYNLGIPKREGVVGADKVHGYKETQQVPRIEGAISDSSTLDLEKFLKMEGFTATLELANGKTIVLRDAWNASEGDASTEEGEISIKLEGMSCEEIAA